MPARHKPAFLSTDDLNLSFERIRSRLKAAPTDGTLATLIVHSLLFRWKLSSRQEDKQLLDLIEQCIIWEERITRHGYEVSKVLMEANNGIFGPILDALTFPARSLSKKIPRHDSLIVCWQYSLLWTFVRDHPFPSRSAKLQRAWFATHWIQLDHLLRDSLCHCVYSSPDAEIPELTFPTVPKDLFLDLLAHLHGCSPESINHLLKPAARRKPSTRKG